MIFRRLNVRLINGDFWFFNFEHNRNSGKKIDEGLGVRFDMFDEC